jgi:superfamily II DNA or RNA helicase
MENQRICTVTIKDEVTCTLSGLTPEHADVLVKNNSFYVPGYKYMPLFKLGRWDGKVAFFTTAGRTYQAFLPTVIVAIQRFGYKLKLTDQRGTLDLDIAQINESIFSQYGITLRKHQVEAVNAIIDNHHKGIILASTGAGKTYICAALSKVYQDVGFRSIVIVPSVTLINQTVKSYAAVGLDVGSYSGKTKDLEHDHVISTWQALKNHPEIISGGGFQAIICDEVHGAKGEVLQKLLIKHGANIPVRVGCTGTLPKDESDKRTVIAGIGSGVVYTIEASTLMDQGLLATIQITQMVLQDTHDPKANVFSEYDFEKKALILDSDRNDYISEFIVNTSESGNTLILVSSVKQGKLIADIIGRDRCTFLYGQDKEKDRRVAYDLFETQDNIIVIANVQIAGTGLSIDRVFNLGLIDIGKSFTRVVQAIGRGLRTAHDKTHVNLYDIGTNYSFGASHRRQRQKYYTDARYPCTVKKVRYAGE